MIYLYSFLIAFFGALSGNFCKLGEKNIGIAGGPSSIFVIQLFGLAYLFSFITRYAPFFIFPVVGFSVGWLEAFFALIPSIVGAFISGLSPFNIRHIIVFLSPFVITWCFYEISVF